MKAAVIFLCVLFISGSVCIGQQPDRNESMRLKYLNECKYDSSLFYAEEIAAFIRGSVGEKAPEFADALNSLAVSHFYLGNIQKAKYYALKEIELREANKDTKTPKYLRAIENASVICRKAGQYEEALVLIKKAEKKASGIFGKQSKQYADILTSIGSVYTDMGSSVNDMVFLSYADDNFLRADIVYTSIGEKAMRASIVNKSNQATYYNNTGNSPLAENLFQEVIALCLKEYGIGSPVYASALNNLAVFYINGGFYKQAEGYFVKAIEIYKSSKDAGSIDAGICISNLAALYHDVGNYSIAEKLVQEAQDIFDSKNLKQSPSYALILNNKAMVNLSREYYASSNNKNRGKLMKCGQILMLADSIFERNIKLPHIDGFAIINNLSLWYKVTGNSKKSLELIMDQASQSNLSLKPISMITKMSLSCQIPLYDNQDAHEVLETVMIPIKAKMSDNMFDDEGLKRNTMNQSASTRFIINMVVGKAGKVKKTLGQYHPGYASMIKGLLPLYSSIGAVETEEDLMLEYINILNHNTLQDFSFLSESEKEMYFQTRLPEMDAFIAYTLNRKEKNPQIAGNAYDVVIRNKGLMLKSSTAMRQAILSSNDPVLLSKYDTWLSVQKEISALYATPVEMRGKDINTLEAKANILEKELVQSSQTFGEYRKGIQITWKDVKNNLKPDEAAVEFTNFKVKERDLGNVSYYCALVIRADSDYPEMVKLFEEGELSAIIGNSQENNLGYINSVYGTKGMSDSSLYKLIWQPLETYLKGVKKVYLSPSGLLYKVSFAAISIGKNAYLCDKYQIQIKGSTGNLLKPEILPSGNNLSALIFGGIKYSEDNAQSQVWNYLKGTKDEGDAVSDILRNEQVRVRYLTENTATETFLKNNARDYSILHVATHGFFFPDPNIARLEEKAEPIEFGAVSFRGAMGGFGVNSFVNNLNPLMRSGLVLAGANDVWNKSEMEKEDDGVLTAQEVTQIDMRKNVLVVLSACETGLGDIKGSEGVYGLQRSFKMAGVKFVLVSLWQVPDKETVEFMESFYTKLLKVKDIRMAFSETQTEMRQKYDPYYWAAFGLIE